MPKPRILLLAIVLAAGCSGEVPADAAPEGGIAGPFPATVTGTIGSSWPLEDGSGRVFLSLYEYEAAGILVSEETYDAKGMAEDDAEVTLSVTPIDAAQCGGDATQCFEGR